MLLYNSQLPGAQQDKAVIRCKQPLARNHYLDPPYLFMRLMFVLPRLSKLDFTIGKEDEMLTVNMVPATSYPAGL